MQFLEESQIPVTLTDIVLQNYLNFEIDYLRAGRGLSNSTTLHYPVASLDGLDVHLERNFFGVTLQQTAYKTPLVGQKLTRETLPQNKSWAQVITNMDSVKVINLSFCGFSMVQMIRID